MFNINNSLSKKYDYERKITLADFLESNDKIIHSSLNAPPQYVFCLDWDLPDH